MPRMLRRALLILVFGSGAYVGTTTWLAAMPQNSGAAPTARTIHRNRDRVAERLFPGEKELQIIDDQPPPLTIQFPTGVSPVIPTMGYSSAIIVTASTGSSKLTEHEDWVVTDWSFRVKEVLRLAPGHVFTVGQVLAVTHDGGEINLGQAHVRARTAWARDMVQGSDYLVFANATVTGDPVFHPITEYKILPDGRLEGRFVNENSIGKLTLKQVTDEIKVWVKAHPGK